jgi:hypothetical protein
VNPVTTSLPNSSMFGATARTITSYGPVTADTSETPGTSRSAAATAAARPASVWIRMYAAIMYHLPDPL